MRDGEEVVEDPCGRRRAIVEQKLAYTGLGGASDMPLCARQKNRTYGAQNEVVCRDNGRFRVANVSGEIRRGSVNFLELIRCVRYGAALKN